MRKLYEKSEIWFAVAWIIAYCVLLSLGDNISASIGMINVVTFPVALLLSVVLFLFLKRNICYNVMIEGGYEDGQSFI